MCTELKYSSETTVQKKIVVHPHYHVIIHKTSYDDLIVLPCYYSFKLPKLRSNYQNVTLNIIK